MKTFIHPTATVVNSTLQEDARVYKDASVVNCALDESAIIGDFTRTQDSTFGKGVQIQRNGLIYSTHVGDHSYTGKNTTIWHANIGKYCSISWNVSIGGANHDYSCVTTHAFVYASEFGFLGDKTPVYDRFTDDCVIGNDVWIGCHVVICRGAHIGDGAVIGAGAVVTRDVEPYEIVAGVPAHSIKKRFDEVTIQRLLKLKWWDFPESLLKEKVELFGSHIDNSILDELEACKRNLMGTENIV